VNFGESLLRPLLILVDPTQRLFFGYLAGALVLGSLALIWRGGWKGLSGIFHKKIWSHKSTQLDIHLFFFNGFLKTLLFGGATLSSVGLSIAVSRQCHAWFPDFQPLQLSYQSGLLFFTVVSFVAMDFSRFFQHYLFHKIPFLWNLHKVHHSATVMTPMTLYRTHPVESLFGSLRRSLVIGLTSGVCIFVTGATLGLHEIFGVNVLDFAFNILGSNLRHSHVWLSFGILNRFFISPAQHQIHHSREQKHWDKNFGVCLSIWDQMFGSFYNVTQKKPFLIFGVRGSRHLSLKDLLPTSIQSLNKNSVGNSPYRLVKKYLRRAPEDKIVSS